MASNVSFAYEDPYAAQYDTSGTFNWAVHGGSGWHDAGYGITTDPWGNVLVTGTITPDGSSIGWNGATFVGAANSNNGDDMFVVKMGNVSGPPPLSIFLNKTDVSCNGFNDGSIDLTPNGGALSYSYQWSTSDTTQDISGLAPGTYTVTVTDTANTVKIDSVTITQPDSLLLSFSSTNLLCFNDNDGSIDLSVSGGTSPFSFVWSNTDTTEDINGLVAGKYVVVVTDYNNCVNTDSSTIIQPTQLTGQIFSKEETSATFDGMAWVVVSGGTPTYTYLWNDFVHQTNDTAFTLIAGTYQVVFTDANGCKDSLSVAVADSTSVGIDEIENDINFSVYPNPSIGDFTISLNHAAEIEIINTIGQIVHREKVEGKETIKISLRQDAGIYLIKVKNNNSTITQKLIIN